VEETIAQEPDGFLWLGDIFDHARPTYRTFGKVLVGLKQLSAAGLGGVSISGNHDTPRVRGTGSPYAALEEVFANVEFAWAMEARSVDLAGVKVHAVPQTLGVDEFRTQLDVAAGTAGGDTTDLLIAHVALTSLPVNAYGRDINELEVEEGAFDKRFDLVALGHYHVFQKASKRTWYAGSTDAFSFADRPKEAGPKGLVVIDTDAGTVEHIENPGERPLVTLSVEASGLGPGELVDGVERAARGTQDGAIVRAFLEHVDSAAFRQVRNEEFQEAVPGALHVQIEPDVGAETYAVQGAPQIGSLVSEWSTFVQTQDLSGLERDQVVDLGSRYLESAQGETV
jgi:DNA repair exonuclease SbcCD nuclease subunit